MLYFSVRSIKRLLLILVVLSVVLPLRAMITWEEVTWIYEWAREWGDLYMQEKLPVKHFCWCNLPIPMPVLKENRRACAQLDRLIKGVMADGKSLEWAVDSLKPVSAPASNLPDSLRRKIIYYLYRDRLAVLKKPWQFRDCDYEGWFIHGGAGTFEQGWLRYAEVDFLPAPPEVAFYGFTIISWARGEGGAMDSLRAMRIFADAVGQGMFVSRSVDSILKVGPRNFPGLSTIAIDVTFDIEEEFFRADDTFRVFIFEKDGCEYLVSNSFLSRAGFRDISKFEEGTMNFLGFSP